jgi:UDP-GlcNAc:undecaprenyl-phosphate GlcNAc-1-phosphate transferase
LYITLLLLSSAISGFSFYAIRGQIMYFLKQKNVVQRNYAGEQVLGSGGLLILIPCLLAVLPSFLISPSPLLPLFVIIILSLAFCGMLDDLLGDSSSKGLADHIKNFLKGSFSTGILKAITGVLIGFLLAWLRNNGWILLILDTFVFAFSVNTVNLMDLRPGRAIKSFAVIVFLIAVFSGFSQMQYVMPIITVLMFYIRGEMEEVYMLGDIGSNLLGGILGFYGVLVLTPAIKGILLFLLLFLHLFTEFHSLSASIENIPLLKKIDMLGRKQEER